MNRIAHILTALLILVLASNSACKQRSTANIRIGQDLYVHQTYFQNKQFIQLIQSTVGRDPQSLENLISFPCGGGAGCYDVGYVITQIIYKMGEEDFIELIENIEPNKLPELLGMIRVGLAYGDHDNDNKVDNKLIEREFPEIYKLILKNAAI